MSSPSEKLLPSRPAPLFAKVSRETEKNAETDGIQQREEGKSEEREVCKNQGRGLPHDNGEEDLSKKKERLDREDEETKVLLASTTGPNPNAFIAGNIQILDRESLEKMSDEAIIQRILDLQTLLTGTYIRLRPQFHSVPHGSGVHTHLCTRTCVRVAMYGNLLSFCVLSLSSLYPHI